MGRKKEPVKLIQAKGRTHFTKKDIIDRLAKEIKVDFVDIEAPEYLTAKQKKVFYDYAYKLLKIGIFTELDEDLLARYIIASSLYVEYSSIILKALRKELLDTISVSDLEKSQNRYFNQATVCAKELGLTVSSRCRLEIPDMVNKDEEML